MIVQNFGMKFLLKRGECKTRENSNFLKKGKMVIVLQNLAATSNFVEFRDSLNFTFFEAPGVEWGKTGLRDM